MDDLPAGYTTVMHINMGLSFVSSVLAFCVILKSSPKAVGSYKYYLCNISLWSFLFDVYMTLFYIPKPQFPALVVCSSGLVKQLGWFYGGHIAYFVFLFFFGASSMSVTTAFAFRLSILKDKDWFKRKSGLAIAGLLHVFYWTPTWILAGIAGRDHDLTVQTITAEYDMPSRYSTDSCYSASFKVTRFAHAFIATCFLQFSAFVPAVVLLAYLCHRTLVQIRPSLSPKTFRMHKELIVSLLLQMSAPMVTLFVPYSVIAVMILFQVYNVQGINQVGLLAATYHSTLNTVIMIASIKPYRRAFLFTVLKLVRVVKKMPSVVQISSASRA